MDLSNLRERRSRHHISEPESLSYDQWIRICSYLLPDNAQGHEK